MPPVKGTPNRRGLARREQIIDAAIELFAERGYRATGLIGLAERVGMTHAGILRLFGTKEALLMAVMARRDAIMAELYGDVMANGLENFNIEGIPAEPEIFTRLAVVLRSESFHPEAPLHDYYADGFREARAAMELWLTDGQAKGTMRPDFDPAAKAAEILAFALGIEVQWLYSPDDIDRESAMAGFLKNLTLDLAAPADKSASRR